MFIVYYESYWCPFESQSKLCVWTIFISLLSVLVHSAKDTYIYTFLSFPFSSRSAIQPINWNFIVCRIDFSPFSHSIYVSSYPIVLDTIQNVCTIAESSFLFIRSLSLSLSLLVIFLTFAFLISCTLHFWCQFCCCSSVCVCIVFVRCCLLNCFTFHL